MTPGSGGAIARWRERRQARRQRDACDWRDVEFAVVDFETTALDPKSAEPLSVGWLTVRDGRAMVGAGGYTPVRHDGPLPAATVAVHGLLPSDLADAPPREEVGRRLALVLADRVVVAHGVFMERAMLAACGVAVHRADTVDTIFLARALMRLDSDIRGGGHALQEVAAKLDVPVHRRHHAYGDALTTAGVFLALAARLEQRHSATLGQLRRLGRPR